MNRLARLIFCFAFFLGADVALSQTTTTVSRLQLVHPDLGYPGGSALQTLIRNLYIKVGNAMDSRYFEVTGLANSASTDLTHNFKSAFETWVVDLYLWDSGTGELTYLTNSSSPTRSQFTLVATPSFLTTKLRVTNNSGSSRDLAVVVRQQPNLIDQLYDVVITSPANKQALTYDTPSGTWVNAQLSLTAGVTGILPTANGGTGQNSTATFPTSGVVVTEAATETLSNKSFSTAPLPSADNVTDLGSASLRWRELHVGPASVVFHNDAVDTNKVNLVASPSASRTLTLPDATDTIVGKATTDTLTNKSISGSTNTFTNIPLATAVTGVLATANGGTGQNSTAVFPTSGTLVTRDATETLSNKTLDSSNTISGASFTSPLILTAASFQAQAEARFADADSSNYVGFKAPDPITVNRIWTLPAVDGASGQLLSTNGGGVLSWASAATTPSAGGIVYSNGTTLLSAAGTSGGIPYFSASNVPSSSGALTANGVVLGGGAGGSPTSTTAGTANQVFRVPSGGAPAAFGAIDLTQSAAVTGALPIANGGTGTSTATLAFNALSPVTTRGDLIARDATNNVRLAVGTASKRLRSDGTDPSWSWNVATSSSAGGSIAANTDVHIITSGTNNVTLPDPTTVTGRVITIKNASSTPNSNINRFGSETIDGVAASYPSFSRYSSVSLMSDGTNWHVLDKQIGQDYLYADSGFGSNNGRGTTNTRVRKFVNFTTSGNSVVLQSNTDATGTEILINATGLYAISYSDRNETNAVDIAICRNTTTASGQGVATILAQSDLTIAATWNSLSSTVWLSSGDVLRACVDPVGTFNSDANGRVQYRVVRIQ